VDQKRTEEAYCVSDILMAKGLMVAYSRSAKPLCVGSIPAPSSDRPYELFCPSDIAGRPLEIVDVSRFSLTPDECNIPRR
jgi:hypothetical protein